MKDMMKNIQYMFLKAAAVIAVVFSMTSCLEKLPGDYILEEDGMKTFTDAEQTLTGIYTAYMSSALYSGYLTLLPDIQCDMVYAVNGYTNTFGDVWRWEILAKNAQIEAVYGSLYSVIGNCNFLLDNAAKLKPTLTNDTELDRLEMYCGEAYFARALAYSELIKLYCVDYKSDDEAKNELGVVLKTKYYENQPIKRASLYDSYQQVLSDLDKAAELLKLDDDYDPAVDGYLYNNSVYFNEYTVYALRARVALYMRDYEAAVKYSSKVIDSDMFFLSSLNSQYSAGMSYYDYMWQYDLSSEVIWKVGFTSTNYGGALGTVFFNSSVPKGKIYATVKDNIVLYYVNAATADITDGFQFTTDQTGLIGIHEYPDYDRDTVNDSVVSGIKLFAENLYGVVVGTIGDTPSA